MIDRKDLATGIVKFIIGAIFTAIGSAALFTVTENAKTSASNEALARAQTELHEITVSAVTTKAKVAQAAKDAATIKSQLEAISKFRNLVDQDRGTVEAIRKSFVDTARVEDIGRAIMSADENKQLLIDAVGRNLPIKFASGTASNWKVSPDNPDSIGMQLNVSSLGFSTTPKFFTSLSGTGAHRFALGVSSIHGPSKDRFEVVLSAPGCTVASARENQWTLNWIAISEPTNNGVNPSPQLGR